MYVSVCISVCVRVSVRALDLLLSTGSVSFCFMLFLKILSLLKGSSWVGNSLTNTTSSSPSEEI